jgi:hypothetical protein
MQFLADVYSRLDGRKPFRAQAVAFPAMMNILEEGAALRLMLGTCPK